MSSDNPITEKKYGEMIVQVIAFLKGKTDGVVKYLNHQMADLSNRMEYEKAATLRDQIRLIKSFYKSENHRVTDAINRDILGISSESDVGVVTMIKYRSSKLIAKESFEINTSLSLIHISEPTRP